MYLLFLAAVNAMATTGVVALAYLSHMTSSASHTVALWLVLFGTVQSVLTWRHLRREQTLSPEGLHLEQIAYDAQVHQMDAQTRRLAIQYAGRAELERIRLAREEVAERREAQRRLTEETRARIDAQMVKHTTPQHSMNRLNTYRPAPAEDVVPQPHYRVVWGDNWEDAVTIARDTADVTQPVTAPPIATTEPVVDVVRIRLLDFVTNLYLDRDPNTDEYRNMYADGRLRKGVFVPWSQRSDLTQAQRRQMEELLRQIAPPLFWYDGGRKLWALNVKAYRRAHHAVDAIDSTRTPS
jgi:hypothetical protein